MLWLKAFPHQLPRPELFAYSFLESLRNWTIYLREREISVSSTETILIIGKMEGRGGCATVKLEGLPLKSICSKHFLSLMLKQPWNLSVLNLSVMFVLYWKPEELQPCQGTQNQAVLCKVLAAGCIKVDRVVQKKFTCWINSGAPSRVVMVSYASQSKFFQDLT